MLLASQAGSFVIRTREVVLPGPNQGQLSAGTAPWPVFGVWPMGTTSLSSLGLPGQEE